MISWWGTFVCQRLASEMVIPTPPPIPAPRPAPNATRSGPWPSPHTCLQHTDDPNRAPPAVPIIAANATGCRPAQLRLGGCCASGVVSHALALAGLTPSRPDNSIDDGIERRIPVLATSPAGTFEGCAITVDGIHNVNTSNPVSVLSIALPQCMGDADADAPARARSQRTITAEPATGRLLRASPARSDAPRRVRSRQQRSIR